MEKENALKKADHRDIFLQETLFKDIYFYNMGFERCKPSHGFGPSAREQYIIHYILSGQGFFEANGVTYSLGAGDFFVIRPHEVTYYEADEKNPWEYEWIGFKGAKVEMILDGLGIGPRTYVGAVKDNDATKEAFQALLAVDVYNPQTKLILQSRLLELLEQFRFEKMEILQVASFMKQHTYTEAFCLYVKNYYWRADLTIAEIADSVGLNSAYFTQVIKSKMNKTPLEYLIQYRIAIASNILCSSNMTISEVAEAVGYDNSLSFSRAFKRIYGLSPRNYVKKFRKR